MRRPAAIGLAILAAAGTAAATEQIKMTHPKHTTELPRPRDGDAAVREELAAARHAGTVAAYDLFLARHDGHPLAEVARRERTALLARH